MSTFTDEYEKLLITQYYQKPKAKAEISLIASKYEKTFSILNRFLTEFDLDNATGDRLDKIGKIVGISRVVPDALAKIFFGFSSNSNSKGFGSKFNILREGATFASKFSPQFTALQLSDPDYRLFIRAKISKNIAASYMINDERVTVQDAVLTAFNGRAYVVDNYNMQATLYISPSFDLNRLQLILKLDLIPKGMAVGYNIVQAEPLQTFSFSNNPNAKGLASKFDTNYNGGVFARKVI